MAVDIVREDTWVCEDCGTGWNSEAARDRCDCGIDDRRYSPSRTRITKIDPHAGEQVDHGGWEDH